MSISSNNITITPLLTADRCGHSDSTLNVYKAVALASCSLSILGALVIIVTYIKWPDIRTKSRQIVLYISLADLVTAVSYLLGAVFDLSSLDGSQYKTMKWKACEAQSWFATTSSFWSFLWTDCLAVYLLICVVYLKQDLAIRLFPLYHLVCWGIPIVVTTSAVIYGALGPDNSSVSIGWCWVKQECGDQQAVNGSWMNTKTCLPNRMDIIWQLIDAKGWEILSYLLVAVICLVVKCHMRKQNRFRSPGSRSSSAMRDFELKLLLIPVVFVLIRAWGTIRYFLTTRWSRDTLHTYCASADYYPAFLALQAFGDPAQGWANCLLYCLFTKKIRERLFPCCREQNDADLEMTYTDDDSGPSYRGSANIQNNPKDVEPCRAGDLQAAGSRDPLLTDEEH